MPPQKKEKKWAFVISKLVVSEARKRGTINNKLIKFGKSKYFNSFEAAEKYRKQNKLKGIKTIPVSTGRTLVKKPVKALPIRIPIKIQKPKSKTKSNKLRDLKQEKETYQDWLTEAQIKMNRVPTKRRSTYGVTIGHYRESIKRIDREIKSLQKPKIVSKPKAMSEAEKKFYLGAIELKADRDRDEKVARAKLKLEKKEKMTLDEREKLLNQWNQPKTKTKTKKEKLIKKVIFKPSGLVTERLEFYGITPTGGKSRKFWEVEQRGSSLFVRFGKITPTGSGRTKELPFSSSSEARKEMEKRIKSKIAKGYN